MTLLVNRIVEGEKIAIQSPSREFGEAVRSDPGLTQEYIGISRRATDFFSSVLPQTPIVLAGNVTDYLLGGKAIRSNATWDLRDAPVVTPPFKGVFPETASPRRFGDPDIRGWQEHPAPDILAPIFAIRLKANNNLYREIEHLMTRPSVSKRETVPELAAVLSRALL